MSHHTSHAHAHAHARDHVHEYGHSQGLIDRSIIRSRAACAPMEHPEAVPVFLRERDYSMEHLWSQAGPTGGNGSQIRHSRRRLK
jgi:hypothetical protein